MKEAELCNNIMDTIRPIIKENEVLKDKVKELEKENKEQESEIKDYRTRLGLRV